MSKLVYYNAHKATFEIENYIQTVSRDSHRKALTPFRLVSRNLEIERGRHDTCNSPWEERFGEACNMEQPEAEFHFLLVCRVESGIFGQTANF